VHAARHDCSSISALVKQAGRGAGRRGGQDAKWLAQVRRSGTAADRVAATTLQLQESAAANLDGLDELLKWVGKRSGARAMAGQARRPAGAASACDARAPGGAAVVAACA